MNESLKGIYIHIPFCQSKCPYCDFYSTAPAEEVVESYVNAVLSELEGFERTKALVAHIDKNSIKSDTLYFGGGTPSLIGGEPLSQITGLCRKNYLTPDAEITVECNPHSSSPELFNVLSDTGVNRISLGMQSVNDVERKKLGRRSGKEEVKAAVNAAKDSGITNISLDLMLGIPGQTTDSLKRSIDFCAEAGAKHVSAYILQIEEGTAFFRLRDTLNLLGEEETCEMYLSACTMLEEYGYGQYEISNFALKGFESRHNLKYWNCEEYLGIGSSAHSLFDGKRYFFTRSIEDFINKKPPLPDGDGGTEYEYVMLRLRLREGLTQSGFAERFGHLVPCEIFAKARSKAYAGLLNIDEKSISFTRNGFLLSNTIIGDLTDCFD
ncbi:MAG: radical SAM family heme chaperone HemW [Clostridiales bacterium]|nr:radical SAM family heme chaperone HemW [Clostridiales bacterium]